MASPLSRRSANAAFARLLPLRLSIKKEQKPIGSYPCPPEADLVWKNRMQAHGGYIQQTISPFQQKTLWPFWHQLPARCWTKFSTFWWMWIWPFIVTNVVVWKMYRDAAEDVKNKYWY